MCPRSRTAIIRRGRHLHLVHFFCDCWHCAVCRQRLIARWKNCFIKHTKSLHDLFWLTCTEDQFPALRKSLSRKGICYYKIQYETGAYVVFTDKHVSHKHHECYRISKQEAITMFVSTLEGLGDSVVRHPVSSCREWKCEPKKKSEGYVIVKRNVNPADFYSCANELSLTCTEREINGTQFTSVSADESIIDAMCKLLQERPKSPRYRRILDMSKASPNCLSFANSHKSATCLASTA